MAKHGNSHRNHLMRRDVHRVRVGRRYWLFTFSDRFGPLLTDEWGEPVDNTPLADEAHPFWDKFEVWQAERGLSVARSAAGNLPPDAPNSLPSGPETRG